jgi:large repetitive protein
VVVCQNITVQLDALGAATITPAMINNGSTDNCTIPGNLVFALDKTTFDCSNIGPNSVILTVTDEHSNSNTCNATVTVEDNVKPVVVCQNITVQLDVLGAATITPAMINNGSTDNCTIPGNLVFALDKTTFDCSNIGPNNVILTATDEHSNSNTCNATVDVQYPISPSVTITPLADTICDGSVTNIVFSNTIATTWTWTVSAPSQISGAIDDLTGTKTSIQQTLKNNSAVPQLVTYTIYPKYYNSCPQAPIIATVWVEPTVTITALNDTICNNGNTNINPVSPNTTTNGIRYTWTISSNTSITGASASAGNGNMLGTAITQTLINSSTDKQKITYTITPHTIDANNNNACTFNDINVDVWVEPIVTITASNNNLCNKANTNITPASTNITTSGIRYLWTASDASGKISGYSNSTGNGKRLGNSIVQKLTNTDIIVHTVTYTITPYTIQPDSSLTCNGTPFNVSVLVNPTLGIVVDKVMDIQCKGGNNGSIDISTKGGVPAYQYFWTGADGPHNTEDISGLISGNYKLTITDSISCTFDTSFTIHAPADITWQPNKSRYGGSPYPEYQIKCPGDENGSFSPSFGSFPVSNIDSFKWTSTNGFTADYLNIANLKAGYYSLIIKDKKGCYTPFYDSLTEPLPIKYTPQVKVYTNNYNVQCAGENNGKINIAAVTDGYGEGYQYNWTTTDGSGIVPGSVSQISLTAGTYKLIINDILCSVSDTFTLTQPLALVVKETIPLFKGYGVACNSGQTGTIDLTVSGGYGNANTYSWSTANGSGIIQGAEDQHTLSAGTYAVTVTYGGVCSKSYWYTLDQPTAITLVSTISDYGTGNTSCYGSSDGKISITPNGGTSSYSYLWSTADGKIVSPTLQNQDSLIAGNYDIEITDANLCKFNHTFTLVQPASIQINFETTLASCISGNDGSIIAHVIGGTPGYIYKWSNGSTSQKIEGLQVGNYSLMVIDQHLCIAYDIDTVRPPTPLTISPSVTSNYNGQNISCNGATDARVSLNVTGGKLPYRFRWSNGDTTQNLTNVGANTYTVIIYDKNNCQGTSQITVNQPNALALTYTKQDLLCYGYSTGNISLNVTGGTSPYNYAWSNGQSAGNIDKIKAGTYKVTVADINNCKLNQSFDITQPPLIQGKPEIIQPYCSDADNGEIRLAIEGGISPYQTLWNTNDQSESLDHIKPGIYIYRITDMNNCVIRDTINLLPIHPACLDVPNAFSPNCDGINDTWVILAGDPKNPVHVKDMYPQAIVEVYTRWGTLVYRSGPGYPYPWDGHYHGRPLPLDSYYYILDPKNGLNPLKGIVTIVR